MPPIDSPPLLHLLYNQPAGRKRGASGAARKVPRQRPRVGYTGHAPSGRPRPAGEHQHRQARLTSGGAPISTPPRAQAASQAPRGGDHAPSIAGVRLDALPEGRPYADTGCDLWPFCLSCITPTCAYETPQSYNATKGWIRTLVAHRLREQGYTSSQIAPFMRLSYRTVQRLLSSEVHLIVPLAQLAAVPPAARRTG